MNLQWLMPFGGYDLLGNMTLLSHKFQIETCPHGLQWHLQGDSWKSTTLCTGFMTLLRPTRLMAGLACHNSRDLAHFHEHLLSTF